MSGKLTTSILIVWNVMNINLTPTAFLSWCIIFTKTSNFAPRKFAFLFTKVWVKSWRWYMRHIVWRKQRKIKVNVTPFYFTFLSMRNNFQSGCQNVIELCVFIHLSWNASYQFFFQNMLNVNDIIWDVVEMAFVHYWILLVVKLL